MHSASRILGIHHLLMSKLVNPSRHYSGLGSWSGELHDADPGQERRQEGDTNKYISCDRVANKGVNEIS